MMVTFTKISYPSNLITFKAERFPLERLLPCKLLQSMIRLRVNTEGSLVTRPAVYTIKAFSIG